MPICKYLLFFIHTHIYIFIYFVNFRLKPLDIELMKKLHNKVNVVPVIAKSDVLTKKEIQKLKKRVIIFISIQKKKELNSNFSYRNLSV